MMGVICIAMYFICLFNVIVLVTMYRLWGPDCLEFKPDRFLNVSKPSPYVFTAFQVSTT
jgi:hypothetical protein